MEHGNEFISLLVVLGLAFLVPFLFNRFKALPIVVGEIVAGLLLAQLGLIKPNDSQTLTLFSNIGLSFLMFLAGLEIDIPELFSKPAKNKNGVRIPLPLLALIIYFLTLGLSGGGSVLLNRWGMAGDIVLVTLVLGATSLGILLPILKNGGIIHTAGGRAIFLTATIADFLMVILFTIYMLFKEKGLSLEILSFVLIILVFIGIARIGLRFIRLPIAQKVIDELSHATVQIKVRGAVVILLVFVVLAESLGIELILGAFLAGMLVGLFKTPQDVGLVHKLEAFGFGMFIPIFFIMTGANLNVSAVMQNPQSLIFLPIMLVLSMLIKLLPALLLRTTIGWRSTIAAGLLLNTHLSLEVAIAVIGEQVGLLTPSASTVIIVFSILTVILMPLLYSLIQPPARKELASHLRLISGIENNLAREVAQQLIAHGDQVKFLINQPDQMKFASSTEIGYVLDRDLEFSPENIETVLALSTQDDENMLTCQIAQRVGVEHIIAYVNEPRNLEKFKRLEVQIFTQGLYRSALITLMARNPNMFDLLIASHSERDLIELTVCNPNFYGSRIKDLSLPGDALVLSIIRDGDVLIPHGNTRLEDEDQLSILVGTDQTEAVFQLLSR